MTELNRRRFLQIAGGTAAATMLNESIARAAAIQAQVSTGTIQDIEHIVVLMQENRSFDQYFGTMKGVRGFGDPRPVLQDNGKSVFHQSNGTKDILPFNPQVGNLGMQFVAGLSMPRPAASRRTTRASTTSGCLPRPTPPWRT